MATPEFGDSFFLNAPKAISALPDGGYSVFTGQIEPETASSPLNQEYSYAVLRYELQDLPDRSIFEYFTPSLEHIPLEKMDVTHHLRDHAGHVLLLTYLYMRHLQFTGEKFTDDEIEAVMWAAVYHDAKRTNDKEDPLHGEVVAAEIEKDNTGESFHIPERLKNTVCTIIRQHVPEDTPQIHRLTRVFKDMDNLLWIRTQDLDHRKFRYIQARDMLPIAYALLEQTNKELLIEKDGFTAALNAAKIIGILQ